MRIPAAPVTHLLSSLVVPSSPEPQRGLWQGAQQGLGVGPVCLLGQDVSWRPDRGTLPLPGQRVPSPRCPSTDASPNTQPRRDSRSPGCGVGRLSVPVRAWGCLSGAGGGMRGSREGDSQQLLAPAAPRSTCRSPQAPFPSPSLPFMLLAQGSRAWGSFQASPAGVWQL